MEQLAPMARVVWWWAYRSRKTSRIFRMDNLLLANVRSFT
jgi:hypothetical protein